MTYFLLEFGKESVREGNVSLPQKTRAKFETGVFCFLLNKATVKYSHDGFAAVFDKILQSYGREKANLPYVTFQSSYPVLLGFE